MLVPSQNPDGVDIVGDWYRATLGTPAEGTPPPELYHHYMGHDNNRDWYAFTQPETRYTVDSLYTPWDPEIVQRHPPAGRPTRAGSSSRRTWIRWSRTSTRSSRPAPTRSGMAMSWRMIAEGFTGVATNASYDQWSPARQYSLNHRGVRILTETASARLATADRRCRSTGWARGADTMRGRDAGTIRRSGPAGTWGIGDIVTYQTAASWALLVEAARDRTGWLESYAQLGERAMATRPPVGLDAMSRRRT